MLLKRFCYKFLFDHRKTLNYNNIDTRGNSGLNLDIIKKIEEKLWENILVQTASAEKQIRI